MKSNLINNTNIWSQAGRVALVTLLMVVTFCHKGQGQSINEESLITSMMQSYANFNKNISSMRGWRVQLLATADRRQMESTRAKFRRDFPQYKLKFSHEPPFFHLKTGAFLTKHDALPFLNKMKKDYASAFLVADDIEIAEVLNYD